MNSEHSTDLQKVENDPRLLFWFAIFLMLAIYVWSFFMNPLLHRPAYYLPFTVLMGIHLFIHWKFAWAADHPRWLPGYVLIQGLLAFGITFLSKNVGMVFCLFMALIGEILSIYKISIRGILSAVYLMMLAFVNFSFLLGLSQAGWFLLGTIPTIIFVAIYVILYTRQAEANVRSQALLHDLETANRQLTEYAARVEDLTIAEERQRMARELHDTLSQGLAGLILQLEAVDAHLTGGRTGRAREILEQSMQTARKTLAEARLAIDALRRPAGHDFAEEVRQAAERFTRSSGIPCLPHIHLASSLPDEISDLALRTISEGLSNIARHSRASNATLQINGAADALQIEISDDGIGFGPDTVQAGHYGLLGLKERLRLAGGTFDIQSQPGEGTRLVMCFPLHKSPPAEVHPEPTLPETKS